jgi:D-3-phosphoglycerate dehydrogenase
MKVLVADKFEDSGLEGLRSSDFDVIYEPDIRDGSLLDSLKAHRPEGLVVRSTKVDAEHLVDSLRLIVRAGAGYNNIDVKAAAELGIAVSNCPGKNANAVAELAWGLILSADRRIPDNVAEFRSGKWNKKEFSKARGLHGRTIGIVGLGSIGKAMIPVARALGMHVIAFSRHTQPAEAAALGVELASSLIDLAARSDVVSIHSSLAPETKGSVDAAFFAAMKPGAIFVNTGRGEVVDQDALLAAAAEKGLRVGLDVFDGEPTSAAGDYDGPLKSISNVYCTHHIGASTEQAQDAVADETVRLFRVFRESGVAENRVN